MPFVRERRVDDLDRANRELDWRAPFPAQEARAALVEHEA
jgi:hypothetical protein